MGLQRQAHEVLCNLVFQFLFGETGMRVEFGGQPGSFALPYFGRADPIALWAGKRRAFADFALIVVHCAGNLGNGSLTLTVKWPFNNLTNLLI
ncbi:MAG: hypothetical protein ACREB8_17225 [Pseudolabrys sp.]